MIAATAGALAASRVSASLVRLADDSNARDGRARLLLTLTMCSNAWRISSSSPPLELIR